MEWLIGLGVAILVWFFVTHSMGNPVFWKLTRKYPQQAWQFFNSEPGWHIGIKPQGRDVTGPFRIVNPHTNELIKVYCDHDMIEQSQKKFIHLMRSS